MAEILPSDTKEYEEIKNEKHKIDSTGSHPEWYCYYKYNNDIWLPHRKPTLYEIIIDRFIH